MSIPFGLMADLHLHSWSSFSEILADGQNSRLFGLLNEIERCAVEVNKAGGNRICIAGDIFHVRGSLSPSVLNATSDRLIHICREYGVGFDIIPGNHDLEGKESSRLSSAVTALGSIPNVRVINEPTYLKDSGVVMVPWIESIDKLKETISALGTGKMAKFFRKNTDLILHAPIDGVIKGLPSSGLSPEWLAETGFKRVFSGHYHNHRMMYDGSSGSFATDVYSIGALAHHTWSDIGTRAGYMLVRPNGVEWRKSHLPEFIDLSQLTDTPPEEIMFVVDQNYVRVKIEADKTKDVESARRELLDMGARAVIVQAQPKPPARADAGRATVAAGSSLEVSIAEYVAGSSVSTENPKLAKSITAASLEILAAVDSMKE